MIAQALARKLLLYVLYSAAVTALPVLASSPLGTPSLPVLKAPCDCPGGNCCVREVPPTAPVVVAPRPAPPTVTRTCDDRRWWCRGPVRRAVRGVALFVSRPWRR